MELLLILSDTKSDAEYFDYSKCGLYIYFIIKSFRSHGKS